MPTLPIKVPSEIFLEHRGLKVFHVYRNNEFPERYQYIFSLASDENAVTWQFDVRDLPGAADATDNAPQIIREALDRCLDEQVPFPFAAGAPALPDPQVGLEADPVPDDYDLLDMLAAIRLRTIPLTARLQDEHIAGAVHLVDLLAGLDTERRQRLDAWLRRA
jgi:hypothetical protein